MSTRRSAPAGPAAHIGRTHPGWFAALTILTTALATVLAAVLAAGPAAALAKGGGTVGDPQPELAKFKVGRSGVDGSGTVLQDGTLVLASAANNGKAITVCVLHPGGRRCASTVTLKPQSGDTFFGVTEVLRTGSSDVSVVAYGCCEGAFSGAFAYNSTDDGATFTGPVEGGNISSVGAGTFADGKLVVGTSSSGSINVQAFAPNPSSPQMTFATPNSKEDGDTSLTTYRGGVLVATDDLTNTYVEYAKSGSDFNSSSSYKRVGTFSNQLVTAVSGNALLTDPHGSLTGGERLRFFNGTSFSKAYRVPDSKAGDDGGFIMQETGRVVHVFFVGRRDGYDVFTDTTRDGRHWSGLHHYGTAIDASLLAPVLGSSGAGLVFESGTPLFAQPILNPQHVHVSLAARRVKRGHSTTLSGRVSPVLNHQKVTLERKHGRRWFAVQTTHESAKGKFFFTVPGTTATYRAVVADQPGYYLYGYSNKAHLTAVRH